jgi:hypothetical protein
VNLGIDPKPDWRRGEWQYQKASGVDLRKMDRNEAQDPHQIPAICIPSNGTSLICESAWNVDPVTGDIGV